MSGRPPTAVESFQTSSEQAADFLTARALSIPLPAPFPELQRCIVVPARNEESTVSSLIHALAAQCDETGAALKPNSVEVLLLLNNCTDETATVARQLQSNFKCLHLHIVEIDFDVENAHVGRARQALFDVAFSRFASLAKPQGLILTTDADSQPAADWVVQTEAEIAKGAVGVGGRILLDPQEAAELPEGVRRLLLLDVGYRRALEEMRSLYAPDEHDPFPRHHQHFGGSFAVTAHAYSRAGGMPLRRSSEDVALYRAIVESGGLFRHSPRVRVRTSARMFGRAQGGLADALEYWKLQAENAVPVLVESAAAAESRLARLGLWRAENPHGPPPIELAATPEPPASGTEEEIHQTLRALRVRLLALRNVSHSTRLENATARLSSARHLDRRHSIARFA